MSKLTVKSQNDVLKEGVADALVIVCLIVKVSLDLNHLDMLYEVSRLLQPLSSRTHVGGPCPCTLSTSVNLAPNG